MAEVSVEAEVRKLVFQGMSQKNIRTLARSKWGRGVPPELLSKLSAEYRQARIDLALKILAEGGSQEEAKRQCREKFGRGMADTTIQKLMAEFIPEKPPITKVDLPAEMVAAEEEKAQEILARDVLARPDSAFLEVLNWLRRTNNRSATITDTGKVLVQRQIDLETAPQEPSLLEALRTLPRSSS